MKTEKVISDGVADVSKMSEHTLKIFEKWKTEPGILIEDVLAKIKSGEIKFDIKKHNHVTTTPKKALKKFIHDLENYVDRSKESIKRLPDNYITLSKIYDPLQVGRIVTDTGIYCWDCDRNFYLVLTDENTLSIVPSGKYWEIAENAGQKFDYVIKLNEIPDCELQEFKIKDKIVTEIDVPSGELAFVNYFNDEKIYESEKYNSINGILGRVLLANELATKNVGYGQMSNMAIDVFVHKNGTEIILGSYFSYDKDGYEKITKFKNFEYYGAISLDVWRWQCADMQVLKKYNEKLVKGEIKESEISRAKTSEHHFYDAIIATVKPGRWVIEHYYDVARSDKSLIYSKLYLKK